LDPYFRTEEFLDQLDTDFIEMLQTSLGAGFKKTLKENIKSLKPRDQYIVLVAGKLFLYFFFKKKHQIHSYCFFEKKLIENFAACFFDVLCCCDEDR